MNQINKLYVIIKYLIINYLLNKFKENQQKSRESEMNTFYRALSTPKLVKLKFKKGNFLSQGV
jgi:hypothetical protein